MSTTLLDDAFAHHVWATLALIDACEQLSPEQLQHTVPGTRGPLIDTLVHLVEGDVWDLVVLEGGPQVETEGIGPDLAALGDTMRRNGERWSALLSRSPEPDTMVTEIDPTDGFRRVASNGIRLAAALQHGSDHRSQICTALTTLGVRPPAMDLWVFGVATGRIEETPGTS
jgi:uncharacterized damage-inducible protein DinB